MNDLITINQDEEASLDLLEQAIAVLSPTALSQFHEFKRGVMLARGMATLRTVLCGDILKDIKSLANSDLGFRTDRAPGAKTKDGRALSPYTDDVIRDCAIEALIRGANITGNEFNIIAGRCYLTKQYFERAVAEFPGLTNLVVEFDTPATRGAESLVGCKATWEVGGHRMTEDCTGTQPERRIAIRVNSGMSADAVLGKAKRKILARVYARLTGSTLSFLDTETDESSDDEAATAIESRPTFDLTDLEERCQTMDMIGDVKVACRERYNRAESDAERAAITDMVSAHERRIKANRGPNANK